MIMVDIETLGLNPGDHILSIGWAIFDWNSVLISDEIRLEGLNGRVDLDTVRWWMTQSKEAQAQAFGLPDGIGEVPGGLSLAAALIKLREVIGDHEVWSNGPAFDQAFLDNAASRVGQKPICNHRKVRCYRTMIAIAEGLDPTFNAGENHEAIRDATPIAHTAQGDAIAQALVLIEAHKIITRS